jgi:hypothetical protein
MPKTKQFLYLVMNNKIIKLKLVFINDEKVLGQC